MVVGVVVLVFCCCVAACGCWAVWVACGVVVVVVVGRARIWLIWAGLLEFDWVSDELVLAAVNVVTTVDVASGAAAWTVGCETAV